MKQKNGTILSVIIIPILLATFSIQMFNNLNQKIKYDISFDFIDYAIVNDVILYDKSLKLDEETLRHFDGISQEFKILHPNRQILFLRKLGRLPEGNVYRFSQTSNGILLDDAELNVYYSDENGIAYTIDISNHMQKNMISWKTEKNTSYTIDRGELKKIAKEYILNNHDINNDLNCYVELKYYNSKVCWKIEFYNSTYEAEILIDANTGKVEDELEKPTMWID